jgi:two-component system sensor histidine kinase PilS (NtrC family)
VTYVLIGLQSLLEISIESGVIYATGNVNSPYSALFVLTIVSAALVYRMVGTLVVASLVSLAYAFIIWLGLTGPTDSELSMQALKTIFLAHESVFYAIFLHILIFYLTAFISGYLAERLSSQDRKLVDASVALRRARLETDDILRHLNSGLLTIDSGGFIIYFNRAAERILGYSEDKVRGMHCSEVFAERMPALAEYLMSGITSRVTYPRKELDIVTDRQEVIPLGLSSSILTEEGGSLRGVIAIFSDLTEAKRMENKVRVNDRLAAVGELSASIAHEIRNPLAAISGSVEVLSSELRLGDDNARLMELILKESHRLNVILSDFLAFARVSRPGYNKVELCHLVSDVRELLRLHEDTPDNIEVSFDSNESIVYVIGDEDHIKQMLVNLALNSCEAFDGRPGKLMFGIRTNPEKGTVDLCVSDDGPGIENEIMDKIFEPFYSTKKQGTGLGLAIVHRICDALKLKMHVDSHPGEGTTFWIQFLVYTQERPEAVESSAVLSASGL